MQCKYRLLFLVSWWSNSLKRILPKKVAEVNIFLETYLNNNTFDILHSNMLFLGLRNIYIIINVENSFAG